MATQAESRRPLLTGDDFKAILAELAGTFMFVFLGAGSAVAAVLNHANNLPLALLIGAIGNGLALALAITIVGHVSGGHLNPAVTIALWVNQRIGSLLAILYIAAQLAGAVLAALALKNIFSYGIWNSVHLGAPFLAPRAGGGTLVTFGTAVLLEAILTFFLVMAVFGTAVDPRHPRVAGFGIGLVVMVDVLVGGPVTGAAMNPARAMGPMISGNFWTTVNGAPQWLIYWIGPILGAIIASLLYGYVLMPHEDIDIASAPSTPGDDVEPVPAPENNPYLDEHTAAGDTTSTKVEDDSLHKYP